MAETVRIPVFYHGGALLGDICYGYIMVEKQPTIGLSSLTWTDEELGIDVSLDAGRNPKRPGVCCWALNDKDVLQAIFDREDFELPDMRLK